jgi:hypothetical protein
MLSRPRVPVHGTDQAEEELPMRYDVISADNHIIEPRELFVTRMPKEFRDRAPRVVRAADGGDGWSLTGETPGRSFGLEATAGRPIQVQGYKWEDILPGNYDPDAHLADMKADGIDAAVLFPTVSMRLLQHSGGHLLAGSDPDLQRLPARRFSADGSEAPYRPAPHSGKPRDRDCRGRAEALQGEGRQGLLDTGLSD